MHSIFYMLYWKGAKLFGPIEMQRKNMAISPWQRTIQKDEFSTYLWCRFLHNVGRGNAITYILQRPRYRVTKTQSGMNCSSVMQNCMEKKNLKVHLTTVYRDIHRKPHTHTDTHIQTHIYPLQTHTYQTLRLLPHTFSHTHSASFRMSWWILKI